jgi:hypothetical protein
MTHVSVGCESALEDGTKVWRQFWRDFADRSPLAGKDRGQHGVPVLVVERLSRGEREDGRRGPVDIGACVDGRVPPDLFRGHVRRRPQHARVMGKWLFTGGCLGGLCEPEVDDLDDWTEGAAIHDHEVLRLDVAMDEADGMDGGQPGEHLRRQGAELADRERTTNAEQIPGALALEVLHGEEGDLARSRVEVDDAHDMWARDACQGLGLTEKAGTKLGVLAILFTEDLDGHAVAEVDSPGFVDLAHSARAELLQYLVAIPKDRSDGTWRLSGHGRAPWADPSGALSGNSAFGKTASVEHGLERPCSFDFD